MAFPTSPTNGQQANINGITYTYSSAATAWTVSTSVSNTFVSINVSANVNSGNVLATGLISATGNILTGGLISAAGNISANNATTGNLTVDGNTTLGDASTDTILMTGAPSIGGAGYGMGMGFRNRIINGAMVIDQRNAGASVTASTNTFAVDRMQVYASVASKFTAQQNAGSVTPPSGFTNYLGVTSSSAYSSAAGDVFVILQNIEGYNTADLGFGAAGASTVTLSFWVRSSLTGLFGGSLVNEAYNRAYPFSYTINSANTWEQKSITIAGDTSGTWVKTNGAGIRLYIDLGCGSSYQGTAGAWASSGYTSVTGATSVVGTNGATFYITGVQLEKGSTATAFDYRPYGTELVLCQRYYETINMVGNSYYNGSNGCPTLIPQNTRKRAQPTVTRTNDNWDSWNVNMGNYNETSDAAGGISVWCNVTGGTTGFVRWSTTLLISAEL